MARESLIGKNYTSPDQHAKVTGRAKFAEDFRVEGMLFAKLLLSPMPHCRVLSVDTGAAERTPGVQGVLTAADLPNVGPFAEGALTDEPLFEGQPILAVAAVDETTAADAIEKIELELEPLPFVLDPLDSLRPGGACARTDGNTIVRRRNNEERRTETVVEEIKWTQKVFDEAGPERLPLGEYQDEWSFGDLDEGFSDADLVIEQSFHNQPLSHHALEPRSCLAYWQNGKCFLHGSSQSIAIAHFATARALGLEMKDLVFVSQFCGGGFGSKIAGTNNMAIPAMLAKKTGRPVMHRVSRDEEAYLGRARTGMHTHAKVGWRKDGRVTAIDLFIVLDNGPYGRQSDLGTAGSIASLTYQPHGMRFRGVSVLTNTPPRAPQRAPGGAQITATLEPLMDRAANRLGIDRLEIRRLNAPKHGAEFGGGSRRGARQRITTAHTSEAIDKLARLVDWEEAKKRSRRRVGAKVTGVGVGISGFTAGNSGFDGLLLITPDGRLAIHSGVGNLGTLSFSDTSRVAADVLGLDWDDCDVVWGSTEQHVPWTCVQAGSMTTYSITRAVHAAAMDSKRKLQEIAAMDLGGAADQYEVAGGRVFRRSSSARGMSLGRCAARAIEIGGKYDGHEPQMDLNPMTKTSVAALAGQGLIGAAKDNYARSGGVYSFVIGFAEVDVDTETGQVVIQRYSAVTDCGTVVNPRSLAGQLHGGAVQGFGMASSQQWVFDRHWGIPLAHRLYTARPPGILDVPLAMEWDAVNRPEPDNPVGAKGVGEPPVGAGAAAYVCAVQDALGDKIFQRTPITADSILLKLEGKETPYFELGPRR